MKKTDWMKDRKPVMVNRPEIKRAESADQIGAANYVPVVKAAGPTRNAREALRDFEQAVIELAFIGTQDPLDHDVIKEEYERTRKIVLRHLTK